MERKYFNVLYRDDKLYYYKIYTFFVKNRFNSYSKFINQLCKLLSVKSISTFEIEKMIEYVKKYISIPIAEQMQMILDYKVSRNENDRIKSLVLYSKIKDIELIPINSLLNKNLKSTTYNLQQPNSVKENTHMIKEERKKAIDIIISENKPIKQLQEEGKITVKNLEYKVSSISKEVEPSKFVEFIKANSQLKPILIVEINQYLEVLDFFCKHLDKSIKKFESLQNLDAIKSFYISGEEKCKYDTAMLGVWKKNKLLVRNEHYHKIKDILTAFKKSMDIEELSELEGNTKRIIKEDMPFICDYYAQIRKVAREYEKLSKLKCVSDVKREIIKDEFKKQLVLRDNN